MLKRLTNGVQAPGEDAAVRIRDAHFPAPFASRLEYNAPVHGTWNIVHIQMAVPESHCIYVCSDNCMRGVYMTAAEMGCADRFSGVMIRERDIQTDNLETITIEGVSNVIEHLEKKPPVIFVFVVCLHIFVGSDEAYIFRKLRERWPGIRFVRAYMDCVRQKEGPSPDMKLRLAQYEPIEPIGTDPLRVNLLGCDVPYPKDCELVTILEGQGRKVKQQQDCRTYSEYLALGDAAVNVCTWPNALNGVRTLSDRLGCGFVYLPAALDPSRIRDQIGELADACGMELPSGEWFREQELLCAKALEDLRDTLKGRRVAIDYTAHPRPLEMALLLLRHGIRVQRVYLDAILEDEREAFDALQSEFGELELVSTVLPDLVRLGRGDENGDTVAVGQKAAWYEQTEYFVNMIEGGGLWGYQGVRRLCDLIREAAMNPKDHKEIVPRKGLGWPSMCSLSADGCAPSKEEPAGR